MRQPRNACMPRRTFPDTPLAFDTSSSAQEAAVCKGLRCGMCAARHGIIATPLVQCLMLCH